EAQESASLRTVHRVVPGSAGLPALRAVRCFAAAAAYVALLTHPPARFLAAAAPSAPRAPYALVWTCHPPRSHSPSSAVGPGRCQMLGQLGAILLGLRALALPFGLRPHLD